MQSLEFDQRLGHDIYHVSVTIVLDATLGRRMYRPEVVIEKNVSEFDAEETRRVPVVELFTTPEKALRYAEAQARKLIAEMLPLPVQPDPLLQTGIDTRE